MNKKTWFYAFIAAILAVVILIAALLNCSYMFTVANETDLKNYRDSSDVNNYYSDGECVPDAKTAAKIGEAIIDNMCNNKFLNFGVVTVEHDRVNRLWKVNKGSLFSKGGFVIIDQQNGEIVKALLNK